jgi:hypothetical protein
MREPDLGRIATRRFDGEITEVNANQRLPRVKPTLIRVAETADRVMGKPPA